MKRIFVAWLGLMAFAGASASAADLPRYQPVGPAYNPIYNWTGFYIGINGGGGWGNSQWDGINKFDVSGPDRRHHRLQLAGWPDRGRRRR